MEIEGIICCSDSPWASPLHMVPKPDSSWRPCGDYFCLNIVTPTNTLFQTFVILQTI